MARMAKHVLILASAMGSVLVAEGIHEKETSGRARKGSARIHRCPYPVAGEGLTKQRGLKMASR